MRVGPKVPFQRTSEADSNKLTLCEEYVNKYGTTAKCFAMGSKYHHEAMTKLFADFREDLQKYDGEVAYYINNIQKKIPKVCLDELKQFARDNNIFFRCILEETTWQLKPFRVRE
jgi:hypothetical protein